MEDCLLWDVASKQTESGMKVRGGHSPSRGNATLRVQVKVLTMRIPGLGQLLAGAEEAGERCDPVRRSAEEGLQLAGPQGCQESPFHRRPQGKSRKVCPEDDQSWLCLEG